MADIGLLNGDCYVPGEYENPWEEYNGVVTPIGFGNTVDEDFSMYDNSSVETECADAKYNAHYKVGQPKMKSITSKYAKKNIRLTCSTIQQIGGPVGPTGDDVGY